jgi:hypothetical protein
MQRDEAIRRFGHHFTINVTERTVQEALGTVDELGDRNYETADAALDALDTKAREAAREKVGEIDSFLGRWRIKSQILLGKTGLHPNAAAIRAGLAHKLERRRAAQDIADRGVRLLCKLEPLPDDIRMPVLLDAGDKIYRLRFSSHMNRGNGYEEKLEIGEQVITGRSLQRAYPYSGSDQYDYRFYYQAGKPGAARADFGFYHDHDDLSEAEIATNYSNTRYFLTREAAEDAALAMIGKLKQSFNALARDVREHRHERMLEASAHHYGLDL